MLMKSNLFLLATIFGISIIASTSSSFVFDNFYLRNYLTLVEVQLFMLTFFIFKYRRKAKVKND